ncbi:MAG: integrase arm-type DNA-binding domain-containing protein [Rhodospirillaceae bacterium]|nr:integrase arm-type DNA-binding domain-containing protein [Rhodospirillaceae bacterium]
MRRLTSAKIKSLSVPGLYGDGGTLYLSVSPGGSKSWIQRITINGKRRDLGLGGFPLVSLAEARDKAFENRRLARRGGDPLAAKRKVRMPSFREAAERTFEANRPRWRSAKVEKTWMQQLERHAFKHLGDLPVDRIERGDVLDVLVPIWTAKPEVARKLRQRMRATLRWAQAHGYVEQNVAGEGIDGALPAQPAVREHLRALPYREVAAAMETVDTSRASLAAKLCLRFTILTTARSGETRGALWSEIDLDAHEWRIPATRMKAGVEHRVPLSDAARAVLEQARPLHDESDLVFPSPVRRGRPLSDMALTKVLRDTGLAERATVHGFRSSFRDWCAETGKPREIAEAALAHIVGGVEGSYFRSDLFERRRRLMADWAGYLGHETATVVRLNG